MNRSLIWRTILVFLILFLSIYLLYPTFKWYHLPKEVRQREISPPKEDPRLERLHKLRRFVPTGYEFLLQKKKREEREKNPFFEKALKLGLDLQGGTHLVMEVDTTKVPQEAMQEIDAVETALEIIRDRIDKFGVAEPSIQRQRKNRIVIQLPGLGDPQRVIDLIGRTALLEFKLVEDDLLKEIQQKAEKAGLEIFEGLYLVKKEAELTGKYLTDTQVNFNEFGQPYVSLSFNKEGAKIFEEVTGKNVNRQLAIVLDGYVASAPFIRSKISGGRASIEGDFTLEETKDLVIVLREGALPVPLKVLWQKRVGPTLGQDSINKGIIASIIGLTLVVFFMALRYKFSGLVADLALFLNLVILLAILALFKGTLTLPGIAGIVLTMGMSVDANVIVFERIKEELRGGKRLRTSIDNGYNRAFRTILDSNLTTLIAAIVLFQFGTGPVKGFALTLSIGILVSMFTAVFATRIVFDLVASRHPGESLSV